MQENITKSKLREFGLLIAFVFPIVFGFLIPFLSAHSFRIWTIWVAFPSFLLSILRPALLLFPYKVWMRIGVILGWINSRIILGLVFFLVLLPISFIMKLFNYDPLRRKLNNEKVSYREKNSSHKIDLTRIF